jgi:L-seryl-tRNA(Ser) seleniumtransferase
VPTLAALAAPVERVRDRAERLRQLLAPADDRRVPSVRDVELIETVARAGAGALPVTEVPSVAVAVGVAPGGADDLAAALRVGTPAVVCRVHEDRLLFDLRAVRDAEVEDLAAALLAVLAE